MRGIDIKTEGGVVPDPIYAIEFELDGLPPMNSSDGMHWRVRRKLRIDWEFRV